MSRRISNGALETIAARDMPGAAPIEGDLVTLEPLRLDAHAAPLFEVSHNSNEAKEVWAFLPDGPFDELGEFKTWLVGMAQIPDRAVFVYRDNASGRVAGMGTYLEIRPRHGAIEMGYIWFGPSYQRSRQSTESLFLMLRYIFDDLQYRRMQWRCDALNHRSRAAALRLGFTFEAIFYQHMIVKGRNRDTAWYSILDSEWPPLRTNFKTWLHPDNFDAQGSQIHSLSDLNGVEVQR